MQNTTADYKIEINKPSRSFECKITIGNNIYTNEDLVNLTLEYTQPQEGFSIGGTISKSLDLTLLNRGDIIYSTSQIKVEIGLKIGSKIEYILMGIFNIDDIEKTDYTTKFTAYDNMIKFETPYFSSLGDKPTLKQVVNELSKITGVEFTGSLPAYTVSKLDGFSCREVLSYVASICGGNAFITRDGKFTIKSLSEVEKSIDGNNYFNYTREEVKYKVGKISCQIDENNILSKGSIGTDSMELGFENTWVNETIITEIYNKLNGLSYLGYSMKWQGDLSLDPYDIITVTDVKNVVRKIPILSQKITYTGGLTSEIGAKGETKNKNSFSSSGSTTNKVNRAVIEQAIIKEALIEKANIKDVEAVSIRTQTLEAKTAKIEEAIIDVAYIKDLNAINANIQNLIAADATINNALIGKADITELNAVKGTITSLDSKIANIETLVNGNLSSENIQAGGITSDKLTIANGFITNAMIANLDVSKINAGDISTNKFRIVSDSGKMLISDNTIQIRDNNRVRVQIGKDASNDYNMYVWDSAGKLMFDATGLKADGIKNKIIRDDMISDNANIAGSKINISTLITEINKDTNTTVIKSSKVQLDTVGQTLDVAFNSLKSNVDNMEIGGTNLATETNKGVTGWNWGLQAGGKTISEISENGIRCCKMVRDSVAATGWSYISYSRIGRNKYLPNRKYTVSFEVKASVVTSFYVGLKEGGSGNPLTGDTRTGNTVANTWIKLSATITTLSTLPSSTSQLLYLNGMNSGTGVTYIFRNLKIEEGTKASNWSPAPEDINSYIESVKQITEINSTTINVMQGQIATAINNTQIVKDGQTILLKDDYNRTVTLVNSINSTIGTHTTKINELTGSITNVDTKVNSVQRDLEGTKSTVSSHTSQINGLNSTVSTQGASISQLKNQIALKVEQTDITNAINNMNIGGTNVLRNGNFDYEFNNWASHEILTVAGTSKSLVIVNGDNVWRPLGKKILEIRGTNTTGRYGVISSSMKLIPNTKYTISGYCAGHRVGSIQVNVRDINNSSANIFTKDIAPVVGGATLDKWHRFELTFTTTSNTDFALNLYSVNFADNGYVWFCDVQIQQGAKATAWTPCEADTNAEITAINSTITTTSNKVATIETNLNSITQRVSSTESTVSTHTSQLSTVDSRINTAKNSAISAAASDATTKANNAQTNAVNGAKSYTDGQITTVNKTITNKVAEIKATTDSITQRVSSTESKITTITTDFNNLKIGGTNLATETNKGATGWEWSLQTGGKTATEVTENGIRCCKLVRDSVAATGWSYISYSRIGRNKYLPNRKYTVSFEVKASVVTSFYVGLKEGGSGNPLTGDTRTGNTVANTWIKLSATITTLSTLPSSTSQLLYLNGMNSGTGVTYIFRNLKIEEGTKESNWSPAPEDVDSSIANVQTQITTTSNKVATIETNLNSITQRVSSTESTTSSLTTKVNTAQSTADAAKSAASTAQSAANTAQSTANTAKTNAATAQSTADSKAKVFTSTPTIPYKIGDLWTGGPSGDVMRCKTARSSGSYTASDWEKASKYTDDTKANAAQSTANTANATANANKTEITTTKNKVATIETNVNSITSKVSSAEKNITTINGNVTNLQSRMNTAEQKITPTAITTTISSTISGGTGSISTTQFVMDKNGLTINNGALIIKNKAGQTVLNSDSNGNISIYAVGSKFKFTATGNRTIDMWADTGDVFTIKVPFYNLNSGFRLCTDTNVDLITAYAKNGDVHRLKLHGFQTDNIKATYMVASKQLYRYDDSGIYWKPIYTRNENAGIKMIDKLGIVNKSSGGLYMQVDMDGGGAYGIDIWSSDVNLKKNIRELNSKIQPLSLQEDTITGLELIKKIKHYEFDYDETKGFEGHIDCGYISQQLQEINTSLVTEVEQEDGTILLQPLASALLPHITKAMQEQQKEIEELKNIILELKSKIGA